MRGGHVVLYVGADQSRVSILATGPDGWDIDAVETIAAARTRLPEVSCVVCEQSLPDGTGLDLCRTVRCQYGSLPVVLVADDADDALAREAVAAGVDQYVPAATVDGPDDLRDTVSEALTAVDSDEQRYRRLVEQSTDVFAVIDPEATLKYVSPSAESVLGYEPAELVGENAADLLHPDDIDPALDRLAYSLANPGETVSAEYRIKHRNGEWRWFEARGQSFRDDPAVNGIVLNTRDVTARKERERKLARYETIVETVDDLVFVLDEECRFAYVNEAHESMTGISAAALVGEDPKRRVPDRDVERTEAVIEELLESPERDHATFEMDVFTADGDRIPSETHLALLTDDHGEYRGTVGIVRDISDRRERERELGLYERMLNTVPDGVYAIDEDGEFIAVNEAIEAITGYDASELVGSHVSICLDDRDVAAGQDTVTDLLANEQQRGIYEMDVETADGDRIPTENHVGLLTDDGEFNGSVGVIRDIRDRREHERRLTVLNRALRHDLRNSMHVILANADLLRESVSADADREKLATIERRAEQINSLSEKAREIEQTLARKEQTRSRIDLATLVTDQLAEFRGQYPDATIEDSVPDAAWVRATELIDVAVANLIENSLEHIDSPTVDVSMTVNEGTVTVTVADDGPGIPETERRVVRKGSETPLDHASGLGLWLVAWITRDSGGEVTFEDAPDGGSLVRLELEAADAPADGESAPDRSQAQEGAD